MDYFNRDREIKEIRTRKDHKCYGMGLGIMLLDDPYPGFPGDVRNASAYSFPIQYEVIEGVGNKEIAWTDNPSSCLEPTIKAAEKLEKLGCRAIAAECGYFAFFQKEVAEAVDIPVFMSSLLQVPLIQQVIGPKKNVGIVCAHKKSLSDKHLASVGVEIGSNYIVAGAQDEYECPEFDKLWGFTPRHFSEARCNYEKAEEQIVRVCLDFCRTNPSIGAIMLECTGFQVFARAIQHAVDLLVFSWGTLLDYAFSVVVHRDYYGHV
ncbi:MAG: aspartate/glutamate racemase family protein [Bacillota bacterium]|jgi:hypothetical protein